MNCTCPKEELVHSDFYGKCTECGGDLQGEVDDLTRKEEALNAQELKIFTRAQTLKGQIHVIQDEVAFLESFLPPNYREKIRSN